ncbi:hypothetical protein T10_11982 [Trichinella papuae]|uniref:Uncharacterized protein n=1 Tax=Trichinella papuae TaxID=268474 RepID=A0A0V1M875_9BILA|nr:hypothetical protein T10_11982 [Trichinella papuae]
MRQTTSIGWNFYSSTSASYQRASCQVRRKGNVSEDGESIRSKCEVSYSI